jgi:hypothetical protein
MSAIQQVLMAIGSSVFLPASLIADASGESFGEFSNASAFARVTLGTAGVLTLEYSANGDYKIPGFPVEENYNWLIGGSSSIFSARMRRTSGSAFTAGSSAINSWLPITSDLQWQLLSSASGGISGLSGNDIDSKAVTAVLEIAYTNNLTNILAQSNISMSTYASTQSGSIE